MTWSICGGVMTWSICGGVMTVPTEFDGCSSRTRDRHSLKWSYLCRVMVNVRSLVTKASPSQLLKENLW